MQLSWGSQTTNQERKKSSRQFLVRRTCKPHCLLTRTRTAVFENLEYWKQTWRERLGRSYVVDVSKRLEENVAKSCKHEHPQTNNTMFFFTSDCRSEILPAFLFQSIKTQAMIPTNWFEIEFSHFVQFPADGNHRNNRRCSKHKGNDVVYDVNNHSS